MAGFDLSSATPVVDSTAIQHGDAPPFGNAGARSYATDGSYKNFADLREKMADKPAFDLSTAKLVAAPAPATATPGAPAAPSTLGNFTDALIHNVMKPLHGAAQLVENAVAKGADFIDPPQTTLGTLITGVKKRSGWNQAMQDVVSKDNASQQQWEQQYQQSVPDNAASYTGAIVGSVAPFLLSGVAGGLQKAGDFVASAIPSAVPKIVPKVVSGATQGAIVGATSPVDTAGDFAGQKASQIKAGMAVGGTIPAAAAAIGGTVNAIKTVAAPLVNPQSVVKTALQRWGVDPAALGAQEIVAGSLPTTAQVAANPDIVAAEKVLAGNPTYKPKFDTRNIENNNARLAAINNVAKTPQDLEAAIQARKDATAPLQEALLTNGNPVPAAPILSQLEALSKSPLGQRPAIGGAASDIAAQIRAAATTDEAGNVTIPPAHLDVIRQNVKDFLAKYAPNGAVGTQQQAAFEPVRGAIVDAIEGANPGYRDYLAKYAKLSEPINTMEAGQSIVDNMGNRAPNASGAPQVNLTAFNSQLKKATGGKYGIAPDAEQQLQAVQDDLKRAAISNSLRVPGSDTNYNLQAPGWLAGKLYGNEFDGGKLLSILSGGLGLATGMHAGSGPLGMIASAGAGAAAGKSLSMLASRRVNNALAEALLNPDIAREILSQGSAPSALTQSILGRIPQASLVSGNALMNQYPLMRGSAVPR